MDIKGNRVKNFKQYDFEIEIIQGNVLDLQRHSLSILGVMSLCLSELSKSH